MINLFKTKQVREAINASPSDVQAIINDSEYCICITDQNGNFAYVNDNYCETYGYQRNELVGKHFSMVVVDGEEKMMSDLHDKFIETQREISRVWRVKTKTGKILDINVDARYTDKINNSPHKITFVQVK
jgi:PAS domain S-box-containing protein